MHTRQIKAGTVDVSVVIRIIDSTDGTPETGVTSATGGLALEYRREGATSTAITESDLAAVDSAHSDGGMKHIGNGYYRVDLPDAACATGVNGVLVHGTATGMIVVGSFIELVTFAPYGTSGAGLPDRKDLGLVAEGTFDAITTTSFTIPSGDRTKVEPGMMVQVLSSADAVLEASTVASDWNETTGVASFDPPLSTGLSLTGAKYRVYTVPGFPTIGMPKVDQWGYKGDTVPDADTAGYPKVTVKAGAGTGEVALAGGQITVGTNNDKTDYSLSSAGNTAVAALMDVYKKNVAVTAFAFPMELTNGTPGTGLTVAAQVSKDGGAFNTLAAAVAEVSGGWYTVDIAQAEMNADEVALKCTATGAKQLNVKIRTQS